MNRSSHYFLKVCLLVLACLIFSFQAKTCHITIESPNGGEEYYAYLTQTITWKSKQTSGFVTIAWSANSGADWDTIVPVMPDTGSYVWTIPNVSSTECLIRITDTTGDLDDESDATFTIIELLPPATPRNLSAVPGEQNVWLSWNRSVSIYAIKYHVYRDIVPFNSCTENRLIASLADTFIMDDRLEAGPDYYYRIIASDNYGNKSIPSDAENAMPYKTDLYCPEDSLHFGKVHINTMTTIKLLIANNGVHSTLKISSIQSSNAAFVPAISSLDILSGDIGKVPIQFTPNAYADYSGSLVIYSNDPDEPQKEVYLTGIGADILPPATPRNLTAVPGEQIVLLSWKKSVSEDTKLYHVYRDIAPFNGCTENRLIASLTGTFIMDNKLEAGRKYYYRVTASDHFENESAATNTVNAQPYKNDIFIKAPVGNEYYMVGTQTYIIWESVGKINTVQISYSYNGGISWNEIVNHMPNYGYYVWTIPPTYSANCLIKINDPDGDPIAVSAIPFSILPPPFVQVMSPNGGEEWIKGSTQQITWRYSGMMPEVRLFYTANGGLKWNEIGTADFNAGIYDWTVPDLTSTNCLIKICDINGKIMDMSDQVFSIAEESNLTLITPNGGETWQAGSSQDILWTTVGTVDQVRLSYTANGGLVWNEIVASTPNDGIYEWIVPNFASTNYAIKIEDTDGFPTDLSDAPFTVSGSANKPGVINNQNSTGLSSAYPNPFIDEITIDFKLENEAKVLLELYNFRGERVEIIENRIYTAGDHSLTWRAKYSQAKGMYMLKMTTGNNTSTKAIISTE